MRKFEIDEWTLYNLYVVKHRTCGDIGKTFNVHPETIRGKLIKFNIPRRSPKILPRVRLNRIQYEFFDGLMISDGSLVIQGKRNAFVSCRFKYKEFAQYIVDVIGFNCVVKRNVCNDLRIRGGKTTSYYFSSGNNELFTEERYRWYKDKKIIPNDFRFSSNSMKMLYLGDGCRGKNGIYLCTDSFDKILLETALIKHLCSVGIECHVCKDNRIYVTKKSVRDFLDFIGPCPVECYKYKWKI